MLRFRPKLCISLMMFVTGVYIVRNMSVNGRDERNPNSDSPSETNKGPTLLTTVMSANLDWYGLEEELGPHFNIVNPHNFRLVITPKVNCYDSELVMGVLTNRKDFEVRMTIRNTWGSYANDSRNNASLIFFLGSETTPKKFYDSAQPMINLESTLFEDILQEDYIDSYENLTHKAVSILKWVSVKCPKSKFVLKVDDDMFINVPLLVTHLNEVQFNRSLSSFVFGHVVSNTAPIRNKNSKWYIPESMYSEKKYPDYTSGPAYAMTTKAARDIYLMSLQQPFVNMEDVYITGILANLANVTVVESPLVLAGKREVSGCFFRDKIAGERLSASEIYKIYQEVNNATLSC